MGLDNCLQALNRGAPVVPGAIRAHSGIKSGQDGMNSSRYNVHPIVLYRPDPVRYGAGKTMHRNRQSAAQRIRNAGRFQCRDDFLHFLIVFNI